MSGKGASNLTDVYLLISEVENSRLRLLLRKALDAYVIHDVRPESDRLEYLEDRVKELKFKAEGCGECPSCVCEEIN